MSNNYSDLIQLEDNQFLLVESPSIMAYPTNIKPLKKDGKKIRMQCILQTVNDINRNGRMYDKKTMNDSINPIIDRMVKKQFIGELDHPSDTNPARQATVLYDQASHIILEVGWDGNKLMGVLETMYATKKGRTMRDLVTVDEIPIGFSYRGMGELQKAFISGKSIFKVTGPMTTITWDCVSYPSHQEAHIIKITESVRHQIKESVDYSKILTYNNNNGLICTSDGYCFLPNDYDKFVETRKKQLKHKLFGA